MRDAPGSQWFHYSLWEDWHAGLYRHASPNVDTAGRVACLLRDGETFAAVMESVGDAWPIATAHNLSNEYRNHRPWLGRSAACFRLNASIPDTNWGWATLTISEQNEANRQADDFCARWRSDHMLGQLRLAV